MIMRRTTRVGFVLLAMLSGLSACGGGGGGAAPTYTIGGTVTGLGVGKSVVLQNSGGNDLAVSADGPFTFTTSLANNTVYDVRVFTQPVLQTCTIAIANASGTVSAANVTNVAVNCVASIALPKTGQTLCYDAGGTIACAGTGQDGDLQAGVTVSSRFVAGPTADCVTDSLTGLIWVRSPSLTGTTWVNALTAANNLDLCGFTDWRLPNRVELDSLLNYGVANIATELNASGFSNVGDWYWSSTTIAGTPGDAAIVGLAYGHATSSAKSNTYSYTWPVRGP